MLPDLLLKHTVVRFPDLAHSAPKVEPLEKGGSDRKYYRVCFGNESLILVKYGDQREENRHYVSIAGFLGENGIRVPTIHFHDESEGLIWMEDLGEEDLWSFRDEPWLELRSYYRSALEQAATLHQRVHHKLEGSDVKLQAPFDENLYLWEQNYFVENCLGRLFNIGEPELAKRAQLSELGKIAQHLATLPRVLVHRDFQSQNIMIKDEEAYLIDFQGLRFGLAEYDIASLIYDPYVSLTGQQRQDLAKDYAHFAGAENLVHLDLCALQRLMQALGAYGFLGLVKGRTHFLEHVPAALTSLAEVTGRIPGLSLLHELLLELCQRAKASA